MEKYLRELFTENKEEFGKVLEVIRENAIYMAKYGITVDSIDNSSGVNLEYYITVPEHSELKSSSEFEMAGLYLGNRFKDYIKECEDAINPSKLRIKIHCSISDNTWTEEESNKRVEELNSILEKDKLYPYKEYQLL